MDNFHKIESEFDKIRKNNENIVFDIINLLKKDNIKIDEYDVFKTTNENVKVTPDNMKVLCKTLSVANKTKDYYEE